MAASITVTGKAGPGNTVTAEVFTGVTSFSVDTVNNVLAMDDGTGTITKVTIDSATTFTVTKSGSTYTITIS